MLEPIVDDPATPVDAEPVAKTNDELLAELDRTAKALKKANEEAAKLRLKEKKLAEIEKAEEEKKTEKLGEDEKLRKQLAAATAAARDVEAQRETMAAELRQVKLERAIEAEARKQGFPRPDKVAKLIDRDLIEYDDDAKRFAGVVDAVKAVAKEYPEELTVDGIRRGGGTPRPGDPPQPRPAPAGAQGQIDPIRELQTSLRTGQYRLSYEF